jgi:surface polysaccharide O-acyltransferase-like enzyme
LLVGLPSSQWALNLTYCSIGYAVLGHYIKNHPVKPLAGALAFLAGLAVTGGATLAGTVIRGELYENFLNGNTLGVCLMAIGLFALCARARELPERVGGALRFIGKGSFGVYLSHLLFLHVLFPPLGITRSMLPAPLGLLAVVFLTLAASLALYFVLSKLPFAKKWLV